LTPRPIVVAKLGGILVGDAAQVEAFWRQIAVLREEFDVIVVHGGGPQATALAKRLGHEPRIVHGRRVTTPLDLRIVQWTIRGELNSSLVAAASRHGIRAVGVSGVDGGLVSVQRRPPWSVEGENVDFGFVGDVVGIEPELLRALLAQGFTPVIAPIASDDAGVCYNVNADTIACEIAGAVNAARFLLVTESGGVRDVSGTLLAQIDADGFSEGQTKGWIQGGMLVKLEVGFRALSAGVPDVRVAAPDDLVAGERATRVANGGAAG
jgi:acetylglutamate kinase